MANWAPVQSFSYELLAQNLMQSNPVLAPVSAYLALGMAGLGAGGETLREFRNVLCSDMMQLSAELIRTLPKDQEGVKVKIAHSTWLSEEVIVRKEWLDNLNRFYAVKAYRGNLSTVETQQCINYWVSQHTDRMIPGILDQPLEQDTMLALFDTVYFKGQWQKCFADYDTWQGKFTTEDGASVSTDMMCMTDQLRYIHSEMADGIILPYQGGNYSFVALMPRAGMTVREMYGQLGMKLFNGMIAKSKNTMVELWLPKFKATFDKELKESLKNMGLRLAFQPSHADFSNLGVPQSGRPIYIGTVHQKSVFRLDEEGTEAAAATGLLAALAAAPTSGETLHFDRPFLYMIIHDATSVPLFMGILDDPSTLQVE